MSIPLPEKYMKAELGIGKLANYQGTQADSKVIGTDEVSFGQGVEVSEHIAKPYAGGVFFGVALAKNYVDEISFNKDEKVGIYRKSEMVPVLRKGSVWVKVDNDVKEGEQAKVTTAGNFDVAATGDTVIGSFQSTAAKGGLAILQINLP